MNIHQFLHNARHARTRESPLEKTDEAQQGTPAAMRSPFEATMPSLSGAIAWLNSRRSRRPTCAGKWSSSTSGPTPASNRRFEIEFLDAGVEAFVFTFG